MQSAIEILMSRKAGKISAQPHTTLSIQFLREKTMTKQYIAVGKTDLFIVVWGCAEILSNSQISVGN